MKNSDENPTEEIVHQIKVLLIATLGLKVQPEAIGKDDLLFNEHMGIDSLAAIQLLTAIEEWYEVELPERLINADLFRSVRSLASATQEALEGRVSS